MTLVSAAESETTEAAQAVAAMDGHDCAWEGYIKGQRNRRFGGEATLRASDVSLLERLHTEGDCPPTHAGPTSPTAEWADLVQSSFH